MKLTKEKEKQVKALLKIIKGGSISGGGMCKCKMCGGSMSGGDFGSDMAEFGHGFLVPWKELGGLFNMIEPGLGTAITVSANALDKAIPGKRYDTIDDALHGRAVKGSGQARVGYDDAYRESLLGGSLGGRVIGGAKRRVGRPCKSR